MNWSDQRLNENGDLRREILLFKEILEKNAAFWTTMHHGHVQGGQSEEGLRNFSAGVKIG